MAEITLCLGDGGGSNGTLSAAGGTVVQRVAMELMVESSPPASILLRNICGSCRCGFARAAGTCFVELL